MKYHERGIIALDDVLLEKSGKYIKDSGTFWDHSESRYMHAQDLIIINYVHPTSRKHYPLEFRRFKKEEQSAGEIAGHFTVELVFVLFTMTHTISKKNF